MFRFAGVTRPFVLLPLFVCLAASSVVGAQQAEIAGVKVKLVDYEGPATLSVAALDKRKLKIEVDPQSERKPLTVGVELPISVQNTWAADVAVSEASGRAVLVRRAGIEWHKLLIPVPAERRTYFVHVVEPPGDRPQVLRDEAHQAAEPTMGLSATISRWYDGRRAALSIRFDDSHPTHLSKAIPLLREYGFRGTFMINPGEKEPNSRRGSNFDEHRSEWEACARRGDQEFANHSLHHRGAVGDQDMEAEIGAAAQAIWAIFPGKSKLMALNLGGGTTWETTRTLRYYLDKYHLFDGSSGSLGMDDVYGDRPTAFRQHLERHIERGLWCRIHFHSIGENLGSSEAHFRAALDIAKERESDLWIAGMADIYKYQTERQAARLEIEKETDRRFHLILSCATDPQLYDQRLTIEVALPATWSPHEVRLQDSAAKEIKLPAVSIDKTIRFHAPPITAKYVIKRTL